MPDLDLNDIDDPSCPACGGVTGLLGQLGNRLHFRCIDCGIDFSQRADVFTSQSN